MSTTTRRGELETGAIVQQQTPPAPSPSPASGGAHYERASRRTTGTTLSPGRQRLRRVWPKVPSTDRVEGPTGKYRQRQWSQHMVSTGVQETWRCILRALGRVEGVAAGTSVRSHALADPRERGRRNEMTNQKTTSRLECARRRRRRRPEGKKPLANRARVSTIAMFFDPVDVRPA